MSRSYWLPFRALGRRLKAVWQQRYESRVDQHHSKIKKWEGGKQEQNKQIIRALQGIADQEQARCQEEKSANESAYVWERRRFWLDATAVIAVFLAAIYARGQLIAMQEQLNVMKLQQRAWLSVSTSIVPTAGLIIHKHGAEIPIIVTVTNHGNTPAVNVRSDARIIGMPIGNVANRYFRKQSLNVCGTPANLPIGIAVFPNEAAPLGLQIPDIERGIIDHLIDQSGRIIFLLSICVEYQSGSDQVRHQTGVQYVLTRTGKQRGEREFFNGSGEVVPAEQLQLERFPAQASAN